MRRIASIDPRNLLAALLISALGIALAASASMLSARGEEAADPFANGGLILREKGVATEMPAMRLGTDIVAKVAGQTARVTVTQAFRNTSDKWMEATYLYPLPDDGAVDTLAMVVGQRVFRGRIKPREEAREIYEQAKAEGKKAGLVEQARPNMFRNSIANVGPGETVLVQIEFQAPVRQVAGDYALRLPLVVGPRYVPPHSLTTASGRPSGEALADAADVTAPTAHPKLGEMLNPVSISVELDPGFVPEGIASPYHRVTVARGKGAARIVTLTDGEVPANRDFELSWSAPGKAPLLGLFRQRHGELDYVMATITPPSLGPAGEVPPREMIFVIDNSGSMAGDSIVAARESLLYALGTLRPQDRFNIIRFDDTMTQLFDEAVPATGEQLATARRYTAGLDAEGGTEMLPALKAALVDSRQKDDGSLRQIVFLTDGSLSNEAEMMAEIARNRGRSRVFMVGIGSAPNTYLMRRMAEAGRGTFTHVGWEDEAEAKMQALLDRLSAPVASNLKASVEGGNLDLAPRDLPDLYAGEPLVLLGRTRRLEGTLTVTGTIAGREWRRSIDLADAGASDTVARLWASRRIAEVEAQRWSGELEHDLADMAVEELGMDFHLVTTRTSLIALDETPSRPRGATLTLEELPLLLPAGWDFDHLFGEQNAGAASVDPDAAQDEPLELPETATGFMAPLQQGLALLALGLVALAWRRRRVARA